MYEVHSVPLAKNDTLPGPVAPPCTGYASFGVEDRFCLSKRATLVSCSSAAVEFNRAGFAEKAGKLSDFEILSPAQKSSDIRATISLRAERQTIDFLHAGFPINFDGEMEHIPDRFIQVTHTLLFAAAMQVLRLSGPKLKKISPETDRWILRRALELV